MKRVSEIAKKNKKKIIEAVAISTCLVTTGLVIYKMGYKKGDKDMCKLLVSVAEEGDALSLEDKKTGLLYEIYGECIGD